MLHLHFTLHLLKSGFLDNDGVGEWATTTLGVGEQTKLTVLKELLYPDSLGLLYSTFTAFVVLKSTLENIN